MGEKNFRSKEEKMSNTINFDIIYAVQITGIQN